MDGNLFPLLYLLAILPKPFQTEISLRCAQFSTVKHLTGDNLQETNFKHIKRFAEFNALLLTSKINSL